MRQREFRFGQANEVAGVMRRDRERQRERIGEADVLGGENHESTRDEPRVFTAGKHFGQPVHRCVGIAAAAALDENGNRIVVLVFVRVVADPPFARENLQFGRRHCCSFRQG